MYTLVIVDDEPAIAEGICRLLDWKSLGFERIRAARSCFEVVSHVVDWKPDVCLVDVRIGNEFGYELINCLNGMGVKSNYIMMSGYDDFQYACEALRCGAVDYLLKPLDKDQLQKRIEQVVVENLHGTVQLEVRKNEDPILRRPYEEFSPLIRKIVMICGNGIWAAYFLKKYSRPIPDECDLSWSDFYQGNRYEIFGIPDGIPDVCRAGEDSKYRRQDFFGSRGSRIFQHELFLSAFS